LAQRQRAAAAGRPAAQAAPRPAGSLTRPPPGEVRSPAMTASRLRVACAAAVAAVAALALSSTASAAAPGCSRGGGKGVAATAKVRVIAIANKPKNQETRRDHIFGCRVASGKRFELFFARDFGLDLIEHDTYEIVQERYIGVLRDFEGGVSESRTAAT